MLLTAAYTPQTSSQTSVIITLMRLGPWVIMKMHPDEKTLRKIGQLTPELRELIARMARSVAKDAVQDVMEAQNLVFRPDLFPDTEECPHMCYNAAHGHSAPKGFGAACVNIATCLANDCMGSACVIATKSGSRPV